MKDLLFDSFQEKVDEVLIRHTSVIDLMAQIQNASSRTNRAIVRSITECGCIAIDASKIHFPEDLSEEHIRAHRDSHLKGELCENCREKVEEEIGNLTFYVTGLCNTLDLNLYDIMLKEYKKINTLGKFSMY